MSAEKYAVQTPLHHWRLLVSKMSLKKKPTKIELLRVGNSLADYCAKLIEARKVELKLARGLRVEIEKLQKEIHEVQEMVDGIQVS